MPLPVIWRHLLHHDSRLELTSDSSSPLQFGEIILFFRLQGLQPGSPTQNLLAVQISHIHFSVGWPLLGREISCSLKLSHLIFCPCLLGGILEFTLAHSSWPTLHNSHSPTGWDKISGFHSGFDHFFTLPWSFLLMGPFFAKAPQQRQVCYLHFLCV